MPVTDQLDPLNPVLLDNELRTAANTAEVWLGALKEDPTDEHYPLQRFRLLLGKACFDAVQEYDAADPLKQPLQRCIYRLAELRINQAWLRRAAMQRYADLHEVNEPVREQFSPDALLKSCLREERRRQSWCRALLKVAGPSAETQVTLWQRREEIAKRLQLPNADDIELPLDAGALYRHAQGWLTASAPLAEEFRAGSLNDYLPVALCVDAIEGWPAALSERHLAGWFQSTRLLEDLPIHTPPMPQAFGAASYLRALELLGFAVREAGAPKHQPYCISHDPFGLESHQLGFCFARLLTAPTFLQRNLHLAAGKLQDHQRRIARTILLESRARAMKVLLRAAALEGENAFREAYPALLDEAVGVPLSKHAFGLLFTPNLGDAARYTGLFLGENQFEALVEAHDEDWFRNPRAADQLRSELEFSPKTQITASELETGAERLLSQLNSWL